MEQVKPPAPVSSTGEPLEGRRGDSTGHEGHQLDKYLRGVDRPGPVFRNHHNNGVSSKRSVPDRGPRQGG